MLLFIKDAWNCSKATVNKFLMLQKISISNKCCSFDPSSHKWTLKIEFPTKILHIFNIKYFITVHNYVKQ